MPEASVMPLALVLLGAGRSSRYGADKLAARLGGQPVVRRSALIYADLPFAQRIAVLGPQTPGLADLGYAEIRRGAEDVPMAVSLAAGIGAVNVNAVRGIMVALADMPLVTATHLAALIAAFDGMAPVCSAVDTAPCPPAIFPAAMRDALMHRDGDQGARALLAGAKRISASADCLLDVDTPEAMAQAEAIVAGRVDPD